MDDAPIFSLSSARDDGGSILTLVGEVDAYAAPQVDEAVDAAATAGAGRLVLDLADVAFMDSSGLRSLIRARKLIDGEVVLRQPQPTVSRLLEITGLREQFTIEEPA